MASDEQRVVFRETLRRARAECGYTQRELASKLNVSPPTVALWETGRTAPRPDMTVRLEVALGLHEGILGRILGQLTPSAIREEVSSVLEAVEADPRLDERERRLLRTMYREIIHHETPK